MADEKIAALELALATLQGEVDAARTTASAASLQAASAEQRATDAEAQTARVQSGGGGLVDTRLLGKPKTFSGSIEDWRSFKFQFLGYAGAVSIRLRGILV